MRACPRSGASCRTCQYRRGRLANAPVKVNVSGIVYARVPSNGKLPNMPVSALPVSELPFTVPLLLPVVAVGLFPLVMLPLIGYLAFVVLGVLIGFAAVMAELEEHGAHTQQVIRHGNLSRAEQAGYNHEMLTLKRTLNAVKIASIAL